MAGLTEHWNRVHNKSVKNITFSADETLIRRARKKAQEMKMPLNQVFRQWLAQFAGDSISGVSYRELMNKRLRDVHSGGPFSRDELNER